jgi:hypothetical protein
MKSTGKQITPEQAKQHLAASGWTYRHAAPLLGVCYQHLCDVLNGRRISHSLLQRVQSLSPRKP